jgi:hypothetical protein
VIAQCVHINVRWKYQFKGMVEVTTPSFSTYVSEEGERKRADDADRSEEEMTDPIVFEIRVGGTKLENEYSSTKEHNDWLEAKMEKGVDRGVCKEGSDDCISVNFWF